MVHGNIHIELHTRDLEHLVHKTTRTQSFFVTGSPTTPLLLSLNSHKDPKIFETLPLSRRTHDFSVGTTQRKSVRSRVVWLVQDEGLGIRV